MCAAIGLVGLGHWRWFLWRSGAYVECVSNGRGRQFARPLANFQSLIGDRDQLASDSPIRRATLIHERRAQSFLTALFLCAGRLRSALLKPPVEMFADEAAQEIARRWKIRLYGPDKSFPSTALRLLGQTTPDPSDNRHWSMPQLSMRNVVYSGN